MGLRRYSVYLSSKKGDDHFGGIDCTVLRGNVEEHRGDPGWRVVLYLFSPYNYIVFRDGPVYCALKFHIKKK